MRPDYASVADYIAAQPAQTRAALKRVRAVLRKALPRATEGISYQIPVYKLDGAMLLYFAGYQHHYAIYPATARVVRELARELAVHLHNKATIRFDLDAPVPTRLITRIAKLRASEVAEQELAKPAKKKPKPKPKSTVRPKASRKASKRPAKSSAKRRS